MEKIELIQIPFELCYIFSVALNASVYIYIYIVLMKKNNAWEKSECFLKKKKKSKVHWSKDYNQTIFLL